MKHKWWYFQQTSKNMEVSNFTKFLLLAWKNGKIVGNNKIQLVAQVIIPVLFALILMMLRSLSEPIAYDEQHFDAIRLDNIDALRYEGAKFVKKWELAFSPINPILDELVAGTARRLNLTWNGLKNAPALESYLRDNQVVAGIQFDDSWANIQYLPTGIEYTMRFPNEMRTSAGGAWDTQLLFRKDETAIFSYPFEIDGLSPYVREGFAAIQNTLFMTYLEQAGMANYYPGADKVIITLKRFPVPASYVDFFVLFARDFVTFLIVVSFCYACTSVVKTVTLEKEQQLKEVMVILGIDNWLHWTAWFVMFFIIFGISSILMVILLKIQFFPQGNVAVSVFTNSAYTVLIAYLLAYITTMICYSFMICALFARANIGSTIAGGIWFLTLLPYSIVSQNNIALTLVDDFLIGLAPNSALALGMQVIFQYESVEGITWETLFQPVNSDAVLSLGHVLVMFFIDSVAFLLFALYFEQVVPGNYSVPREWYFPFTKEFWCPNSDETKVENVASTPNVENHPHSDNSPHLSSDRHSDNNPSHSDKIEPYPIGKKAGIRIVNLRKEYGTIRVAVRNLTMDILEDEITVLLGHNGAGKTTTISMLTGIVAPTSGTAIINDHDVTTDFKGARESIGLCPQHNILFKDLTVREHIEFFSRLKGLKGKALKAEVTKYINLLDLKDKKNKRPNALSGGMKRKLSVGLALCGKTKTILLDEPTAGMDPSARRALWNLLAEEKQGRTILLTTHLMDEADVLGDRIGVLSNGKLMCYGSSFYLKKEFATGYRLIFEKGLDCNSEEVTTLMRKYVPDIEIESEIGSELTYQLPETVASGFNVMLHDIEESLNDLHLNGFGISVGTLEEVFMAVGRETSHHGRHPPHQITITPALNENTPARNPLTGRQLLFSQLKAMVFKKWFIFKRNLGLFIASLLIVLLFISLSILTQRVDKSIVDPPPLPIDLDSYEDPIGVLDFKIINASDFYPTYIAGSYANYFVHESYKITELFEKDPSMEDYILNLYKNNKKKDADTRVAGMSVKNNFYYAWFNHENIHSVPLAINLVHNAMLRFLAQFQLDDGSSFDMKVTNHPLSPDLATVASGGTKSPSTSIGMNTSFCMILTTGFLILYIIRERVSKSKLLQFVGGVRIWMYWTVTFLMDFVNYIAVCIFIIILFAVYQEDGWRTFPELGRILLVFIFFGINIISFMHLFSRMFKEPLTGFTAIIFVGFFTGIGFYIISVVLQIEQLRLTETEASLKWFFLIFPHYALTDALGELYKINNLMEICNQFCENIPVCTTELLCIIRPDCCSISYFQLESPGIGRHLIYLSISAIIFFIVNLLIDYEIFDCIRIGCLEIHRKIKMLKVKNNEQQEDTTIDEEVQTEKDLIKSLSDNDRKSYNLILDEATKYYGTFLAVNQLSLGVKGGECFGLLGLNGAGKTTTFKMMTGDESITKGKIYVKGISTRKHMVKIYPEIGYCPQYDALLEDLTGTENILIFCLIRGLPKKEIYALTLELAWSFGFAAHLDKRVKNYSGGTRRKLSVAISLIGDPSVIFLDEPSNGIDPSGRRRLWNMITKIRDSGKSIILTSHSMEECEALCTRLAIMVNGEFKCLGSSQFLKIKFSKGFIMKIKMKAEPQIKDGVVYAYHNPHHIAKVKNFVKTNFPEGELKDEHYGILTYHVLAEFKWSFIFGLFEKHREELFIDDYSISQATLEEIFLDFARQQHERHEHHRRMV